MNSCLCPSFSSKFLVQSSTQGEEDWWLFWCALNCMTCQEISLFVQCREQIWQDINKQQPYDFYLSTDYRLPMKPFFIKIQNFWYSESKETWLIWLCESQYDVIRFVSVTSLCSTVAPDCRTGKSKGRYCKQDCSIPVVVIEWVPCPCFSLFNQYFY